MKAVIILTVPALLRTFTERPHSGSPHPLHTHRHTQTHTDTHTHTHSANLRLQLQLCTALGPTNVGSRSSRIMAATVNATRLSPFSCGMEAAVARRVPRSGGGEGGRGERGWRLPTLHPRRDNAMTQQTGVCHVTTAHLLQPESEMYVGDGRCGPSLPSLLGIQNNRKMLLM